MMSSSSSNFDKKKLIKTRAINRFDRKDSLPTLT